MKKKATSQSAFFNLRVLIGLCIVLVGVVLALAQFGVFSAAAQGILQAMTKGKIITQSQDPLVPVGFDCSTIHEKGIDKQENFRAGAIMTACGETPGVSTSATSTLGPVGHFIKKLLMPLAFGAADVNLITGTETSPNITQSETFSTANPDNPNQIVVAYNDSRGRNFSPINISGASASTDGGATWTNTYTGPAFQGAHRTNSGYFACMYNSPAYWRHMGWGEPTAFNHVVGLVYAASNPGNNDPGDVFYIRSTDSGVTFSAPFQLNSNADATKAQWQPNLSVSEAGTLFAMWYDETPRVAASCQPSSPGTPCYQMHARKSNDGGVTWLADDTLSDVASPLPLQGDPGIQPLYAGDYDYGSSILTKHVTSWVDGRNPILGASQQDAFTDRELVGFAVTTTTPACNSLINTQPVDFVIKLSDPVNTATVAAGDFTVNGTPSNLPPTFSNGNATITFHFSSSPVTTPGPQMMDIPANAFNRQSDGQGNFAFNCTFCYDTAQLQVTTTVPPVGGTFSPPAPGDYPYDVNFNMAVDAASVQTSDLTLTGNAGGSVTAVQLVNGNMTARFTVHFNFGGSVTASIGAGAITAHTCNGVAAFSGEYTVEGCPPQDHYGIAQIGGSIVPGTTDTGNQGDDTVTTIALTFTYTTYDQSFNSINLSSNGNAQFTTTDNAFTNVCPLPWLTHDYTIFPYWDDLRTDNLGWAGCAAYPNGLCGVFTSITGSAPNRIFNIEWRAVYFANTAGHANHELRLYEGQVRFDVIYGTVDLGNSSATAGVQRSNTAFDQYFCNGSGGQATGGQSYTITPCGTPTPTPTATATATPTATATATPTATVAPSPTPTPGQIVLHARGYKIHGLQTVDLFWNGATSTNVDIYRNGVLIATVLNDGGFYTDHINRTGRGTYTYRVCEAGTGNCSNQVTVRFGGG